MAVVDYFSQPELDAIRVATERAEAETGGELVCVIVERCDSYEASIWKAATLGALSGVAVASIWYALLAPWGQPVIPWLLLPALLGTALALLIMLLLPGLQRALISPNVVERRVDRRAATAFLDEEIFDTRDRTGVLLFLALFEHQIRIVRDKGVEKKISPEAWQEISEELARGLRAGRPGPAVVRAIEACGDLLTSSGVAKRTDDRNELSNEPRLHDD